MSLDKEASNPGYRLGRLFAVLESAQHHALGGKVNATIRDRYYGAASATPATVFPMLLRNPQHHLSTVRKEKPGLAVTLEKEISEIIDGLPPQFPRSLRLEDQGRLPLAITTSLKPVSATARTKTPTPPNPPSKEQQNERHR